MIGKLVQPCHCTGSVRFAHLDCIRDWTRQKGRTTCELCKAEYSLEVRQQLSIAVQEYEDRQVALQLQHELGPQLQTPSAGGTQLPAPERRSQAARRARFYCKLVTLLLLIALIFYLIFGVNTYWATNDNWTLYLLRFVGFVIPLYLVVRVIQLLHREAAR